MVILSWKSSVIDLSGPDDNPVKCVFNALTKFDTPKTCKNVFVLGGGLFEWMSLYPHLMTDPTAGAPLAQFAQSDILGKKKILIKLHGIPSNRPLNTRAQVLAFLKKKIVHFSRQLIRLIGNLFFFRKIGLRF